MAVTTCIASSAMPADPPHLDLDAIDFPTDKLTLKEIRQHNPSWFDEGLNDGLLSLAALYRGERALAEGVFDTVLGRDRETHPGWPFSTVRKQIEDNIAADYVMVGIATGKRQAKEMIRRFEAAAEAQALAQTKGRRR